MVNKTEDADVDPRKDPLDTKVVREWEQDSIVYRYVTFHIGTFKGKPARMAAFFGFPNGTKNLPGLLHLHGGGQTPNGDVGLFNATIGFESYAPHVKAPLLWLGATNDFHGIMDDTYRTGKLIPHQNIRYAFTPHMNHRFTPEFAVARPLWMDQYLKGRFTLPGTPESKLVLIAEDGIPVLQVTPDTSMPIERVQLLYSVDPDPQARLWRTLKRR